MAGSDLRRDLITRRWVLVAMERSKRPSDFGKQSNQSKRCPFCPGSEEDTPPEIRSYRKNGSGPWIIRVVPNKFGAVAIYGTDPPLKKKIGIFRELEGRGAHEVIITTPDHKKRIYDFISDEMNDILWMCKERTLDLRKDSLIGSATIFGNEGEAAGASLEHEHWQLVGLPTEVIPKNIHEELESCREYYDREDGCAFCDLTIQEFETGSRIISQNDSFYSLCCWAGRVPFETWILPKMHRPAFEDGGEKIMRSLAEILMDTIKRIGAALNRPDFNIYFHSAPLQDRSHDRYYHFHIEIIPRVTEIAGFEWGTGLFINPTVPEDAARFLREAKV